MISVISAVINELEKNKSRSAADVDSQTEDRTMNFSNTTTLSDELDIEQASEQLPNSWALEIKTCDDDFNSEEAHIFCEKGFHPIEFHLKPEDNFAPGGKTKIIRDMDGEKEHCFGCKNCFEKAFRSVNNRIRSITTGEPNRDTIEEVTPDKPISTPRPTAQMRKETPPTPATNKRKPAKAKTDN